MQRNLERNRIRLAPAETHSCATLRTPSIRFQEIRRPASPGLMRAHPAARRTEECDLRPGGPQPRFKDFWKD